MKENGNFYFNRIIIFSPICYESFLEKDEIVWCENSCGNNVHLECFNKWSDSLEERSEIITCVWCRSPWEKKTEDYLNLSKYE